IYATIQLARFHLPNSQLHYQQAAQHAFLLIWLLATLFMFSRLNIVVGTHYHLPAAPPLALASATGLAILLRSLSRNFRNISFMYKRDIHAASLPLPSGKLPKVIIVSILI